MDKEQTGVARRQREREYRGLVVNSREQLQVKYRGGYVPHMSFLLFLAHFTDTRGQSRTDGQVCGCVLTQCFSNQRFTAKIAAGVGLCMTVRDHCTVQPVSVSISFYRIYFMPYSAKTVKDCRSSKPEYLQSVSDIVSSLPWKINQLILYRSNTMLNHQICLNEQFQVFCHRRQIFLIVCD